MNRFWGKVERGTDSGGCWNWTAYKNPNGYGQFGVNMKLVLAHRFSWELEHGDIPEGMHCLHKCDNPACVRTSHLFIGTQAENVADMIKKGRQAKGEKNGMAKLDTTAVRIIRTLYRDFEFKQWELADLYSVHQAQISKIINRKWWKHLQ